MTPKCIEKNVLNFVFEFPLDILSRPNQILKNLQNLKPSKLSETSKISKTSPNSLNHPANKPDLQEIERLVLQQLAAELQAQYSSVRAAWRQPNVGCGRGRATERMLLLGAGLLRDPKQLQVPTVAEREKIAELSRFVTDQSPAIKRVRSKL